MHVETDMAQFRGKVAINLGLRLEAIVSAICGQRANNFFTLRFALSEYVCVRVSVCVSWDCATN